MKFVKIINFFKLLYFKNAMKRVRFRKDKKTSRCFDSTETN